MKRELKTGDKVSMLLDPLSHGANMTNLRIEVEILDVQSNPQSCVSDDPGIDVEFDLEVAAFRVLSQDEVDDNGIASDHGNWSPMVGQVQTIVSVNGADWHHTAWSTVVNFEGESKQVPNELRSAAWDALYEQARGMDSDSLAEYYADNEIGKYDEAGMKELTKEGE